MKLNPYQHFLMQIHEAHSALEAVNNFDLREGDEYGRIAFAKTQQEADVQCLTLLTWVLTHAKEIVDDMIPRLTGDEIT